MKNRKLIIIFMIILLSETHIAQNSVEHLTAWMTGSFSSLEQSENDTNYFNIELEMVQIWTDRTDGPWIYVEQAVAAYKDKPYRQRVYQLLKKDNDEYASVVYAFNDPQRFAGDWELDEPLSTINPDSLTVREGCAVILKWNEEGYYEGSTVDKECVSTMRGASYATSEVKISEDKIVSWDRGFNSDDERVWGAEKGGYVFMKKME